MKTGRLRAAAAAVCLLLLACAPAALAAGRYSVVRLLAEGSALESGALEAGAHTALTVSVRNTSRYSDARNCKFTLEGGSALIPDGAASVYVESIGRGEAAPVAFAVLVLPDAAPGWTAVRVTCEYEDDGGAQFTSADTLWLEVIQPIRLAHSAVTLPTKVTEGTNLSCAVDLMNMGKGTLYNALVTFDLPFLAAPQSVLVGEIAPGATQTARANLAVQKGTAGEAAGTVTISAENAAGERTEETVALSTLVAEPAPVPESDSAQEEDGFALPGWLVPSCVAAAGTGLIVCVQIGIEKRRRRERDERML